MKPMMKIAIDGPSGSGKSTLAKNLAESLNCKYLDTGALYRTVGLYIFREKINYYDAEKIRAALNDIHIEIEYDNFSQIMFLNGKNVTAEIRGNEISQYASAVSAIPEVRNFLLDIQRKTAYNYNIIMDGRDIGTVIMPDAQVKIFLQAGVEERAKRRYEELKIKGQNVIYENILKEIEERDKNDSSRNVAPLVPAQDAVIINNSDMTETQTLNTVLKIVREKFGANEKQNDT